MRPKPHVRTMIEKEILDGFSRLQSVGPSLTITPRYTKLMDFKRQRQLEDKYTQIEKENLLLLEKMTTIMKRDRNQFQTHQIRLSSQYKKRQEEIKIQKQNKMLLNRINASKSEYQKRSHDQSYIQNRQYAWNLNKPF
ncbi:hypothetical protein pb186bvf_010776 [Paramecium bursaria]